METGTILFFPPFIHPFPGSTDFPFHRSREPIPTASSLLEGKARPLDLVRHPSPPPRPPPFHLGPRGPVPRKGWSSPGGTNESPMAIGNGSLSAKVLQKRNAHRKRVAFVQGSVDPLSVALRFTFGNATHSTHSAPCMGATLRRPFYEDPPVSTSQSEHLRFRPRTS